MIITCNKCSTRFNLDDSLVKEEGSKVRCSVCKDTFTAYPLGVKSDEDTDVSSGLSLATDTDDSDMFEEPSEFEMEDSDFSLEDSDLETQGADFEMADTDLDFETDDPDSDTRETSLEADDDFSFEESELETDVSDDGDESDSQELELEENSFDFEDGAIDFEDTDFDDTDEENLDEIEFEPMEDEEPASLDMEDNESNLSMEDSKAFQDTDDGQDAVKALDDDSIADDDEFELEFDVEDTSDDDIPDIDDDIPDEIPLEMETDPENEEIKISPEENLDEGEEPPAIPLEDDFSPYDDVLEQETEPETVSLEEETIEIEETQPEEEMPAPEEDTGIGGMSRSRRRKKKPLVGAPVLVLLLIFLLVIGAYIASVMTGYKIPYLSDVKVPFIEQYLKKPATQTAPAKPVPNQKSVNGRFVTNSSAGALFVITGRVENPSKIAYSHIEVRGALITKGKEEAKTKTAFCGNIITEEMLKTGNISDINKLLAVKAGAHNTNVNIKPGASVPFMVVFSDLPDKLQNFTVKVLGFEKAKK